MYKAKLKSDGTVVAVKVQRPYVLETVALDLYLVRLFGETLKNLKVLKGSARHRWEDWGRLAMQ